MPDVPESVGKFTVTGLLWDVVGDSDDVGDLPDVRRPVATAIFAPERKEGVPPAAPGESMLLGLNPVVAGFDGLGRLVPPADGHAGPLSESREGVTLVSPMAPAITDNDWHWRCTITPARRGSGWEPFSVRVVGYPGEVLNLAELVTEQKARETAQIPPVWFVNVPPGGASPEDVAADVMEAAAALGARPGHFIVNQGAAPWTLYVVNGD